MAPEVAPRVWPHVESFIDGALRRSDAIKLSLPVDILMHILAKRMDLWVAHDGATNDAAIVTRISEWDRAKTLQGPLIGGKNLREWEEPLLAELDKFGRANNCIAIEGFTRKGWARKGFRVTGVTLQRDLT